MDKVLGWCWTSLTALHLRCPTQLILIYCKMQYSLSRLHAGSQSTVQSINYHMNNLWLQKYSNYGLDLWGPGHHMMLQNIFMTSSCKPNTCCLKLHQNLIILPRTKHRAILCHGGCSSYLNGFNRDTRVLYNLVPRQDHSRWENSEGSFEDLVFCVH